jgi:hypothetical protein
MRLRCFLPLLAAFTAWAEPAPIVREGHGPAPELVAAANALRESGVLLALPQINEQLRRSTCELALAPAAERPLNGSEVWQRARAAHIRVGHLYQCNKCNDWHINLAGGYAISADGAVATCYHVVEPKDMREGYLIAANEADEILPVKEILAADKFTDSCIVRVVSSSPLIPLPLRTTATPGEMCWCYSDPLGHPGYFSAGIVNRIYQHWHGPKPEKQFPVRMNVSTDWAPGSSGSAVLDSFGNAIGHVSEISAHGEREAGGRAGRNKQGETLIVFHDAVRAAEVLALIKPKP